MPSHPVASQMPMCPLGFQCIGLRTAAAETPLRLLKPSESPKEDSQAPAQAVTIVIRTGEPAPEPRGPPVFPKNAAWRRPCLSIPYVGAGMLEAGTLVTHVLPLGTTGLHRLLCPAGSLPRFGLGIRGSPWEKHRFRHELHQFSARLLQAFHSCACSGIRPCAFTAGAEAGGTSEGIRVGFPFFLLFRLFFSLLLPLWFLAQLLRGVAAAVGRRDGMKKREMVPHAAGQGVGCSMVHWQGDFCAWPYTVLSPAHF